MKRSNRTAWGRIDASLVTGAAGGLGRAIAERLSRDGIRLIVADRDHSAAQGIASQIGNDARTLAMDVSDEASVTAAFQAMIDDFGRLDILVSNADIAGIRTPAAQMSLDDWERVPRVNLTGTFLVTRAAIPFLERQPHARIVLVASQAARGRTGTGKAQYATSKGGMIAFARVVATKSAPPGSRSIPFAPLAPKLH